MSATIQDRAYFLHQTPYRDNSALVHLLTHEHGKVSFIVSGLKAKRNAKRPYLQPCRLLSVHYQLKANLSKLIEIDFADDGAALRTPAIAQFMLYQYANELLLTVLPAQLPAPALFSDYQQFLQLLAENKPHAALRHIELSLIILFSGLPDVGTTEDTRQAILQDQRYWFYPERGLFSLKQADGHDGIAIDGAQVQAFQHCVEAYLHEQSQAINETVAQGAKILSGSLIRQLLNGKVLKTRAVYQELNSYLLASPTIN